MIEPLINYESLYMAILMAWSPFDEAMTSADIDSGQQ